MSNQKSIYAFFARAEDRAVGMMIDTSSEEKWMNNIRRAVAMPDAEIHLVREGEWNAPAIKSVEQNPNTFVKGESRYLIFDEGHNTNAIDGAVSSPESSQIRYLRPEKQRLF